jgi:hypothetical protein
VRLVEVLANRSSDHTPLLISFNKQVQVFRKKHYGFRYEANWSKNDKTKQVVRQAWKKKHHQCNTWEGVKKNIASCQKKHTRWQRVNKDPTYGLITKKTSEIQQLQEQEGVMHQTAIRVLQGEVNELVTPKKLDENLSALNWLSLENDFFNY